MRESEKKQDDERVIGPARSIILEMEQERDDCTPATTHTDVCGDEAMWPDGEMNGFIEERHVKDRGWL